MRVHLPGSILCGESSLFGGLPSSRFAFSRYSFISGGKVVSPITRLRTLFLLLMVAAILLAIYFALVTAGAASSYVETAASLEDLQFEVSSFRIEGDSIAVDLLLRNGGDYRLYVEALVLSFFCDGQFAFSLPNVVPNEELAPGEELSVAREVSHDVAGECSWSASGTVWVEVGPQGTKMPVRLRWIEED